MKPDPSLSRLARSGVSGRLPPTLLDSRQWPSPCLRSVLLATQGPFPRPALPGVLSTTGPSVTMPAQPAPRGVPVGVCAPPAGLPVLLPFTSSMRAAATTPARPAGARVARFPVGASLPRVTGGSALASYVFEACSAFTRVAARMVAEPSRAVLLSESFGLCRYLHNPLQLLPAGAKVAGRDSHALGKGAFPRRTLHW